MIQTCKYKTEMETCYSTLMEGEINSSWNPYWMNHLNHVSQFGDSVYFLYFKYFLFMALKYVCTIESMFVSPVLRTGLEFSLLQNLTEALSDDDAHYVIRFANALFLQEGISFNPEFLHLMKKYFRAEVENVDFSESSAVADRINNWVENHTERKENR